MRALATERQNRKFYPAMGAPRGVRIAFLESYLMQDARSELIPIADLKPYENNPRSHSKKQIRAVAESIKLYGFNTPIVIDEHGVIVAGHCRLEAAKLLALETVPAIRLANLSQAELRAYRIADNKTSDLSQWDKKLLAVELQAVLKTDIKLESATAFSTAEVDNVLSEAKEAFGPDVSPEDLLPAQVDGVVVSRPGDVWLLGNHALMVADARSPDTWAMLMGTERAAMMFTDPPYNVPIDGFAVGKGKNKHSDFAMACGEMSDDEFEAFLVSALEPMQAVSALGAVFYVCMDWRHLYHLLGAGRRANLEQINLVTWVKSNGGMGSLYRSRHEQIVVFRNGGAPNLNNVELGKNGRNRTNVWEYAGANAFSATRAGDLADHPTVKPARMVADAIKDVTRRNDYVLDGFAGSGTTLIAAEMTGRIARAAEIDPHYVDVAVRRWQAATGRKANLHETGETFEEREEAVVQRSKGYAS